MTQITRILIERFRIKLRHLHIFPLNTRTCLLGGLFILSSGIIYDVIFAGIPYQDPTIELQHHYEFHSRIAGYIRTIGLLITLCCGLFAVRRFWRTQEDKDE